MNKNYDVVIAGGGVIGASCAYQLSKKRDLKIALVDAKRPGNASRASAGGLWAIGESVGLGCGVIFFRMQSALAASAASLSNSALLVDVEHPHILPESFFNMALMSNAMYPQLHQELLEYHGMDCKFERTGLKFVMYDEQDRRYAQHIVSKIPQLSKEIQWLDRAELQRSEPYISRKATGALEFLCDHQISPFRLTDAYLEGARQNGVVIYNNTNIIDVYRQDARIVGVETDRVGRLSCNSLINAAGSWASTLCEWATGCSIPVHPVKGQIVLSERVPKLLQGSITTSDCYIVQKDNGEILIGSTTEDKGFDVTTTLPEIRGLVQGAIRCIPALKEINIKRSWAGLRPGSPDELPILGPMEGIQGYFNACGHFRTGILTSAITGVLLNQLVREEPLALDIVPFLAERFNAVATPTMG